MNSIITVVLPLLVHLKLSNSSPLPQPQHSPHLPEVFIPLSLTSADNGVRFIKNQPEFQIFPKSHQTPSIFSSQGITSSYLGGNNQQLQNAGGGGFVNGLVDQGFVTFLPRGTSQIGKQTASTTLGDYVLLNPVSQPSKHNFQVLPITTTLQPSLASGSFALTENLQNVPYFQTANNGVIGSGISNEAVIKTLAQYPKITSGHAYPSITSDYTLANSNIRPANSENKIYVLASPNALVNPSSLSLPPSTFGTNVATNIANNDRYLTLIAPKYLPLQTISHDSASSGMPPVNNVPSNFQTPGAPSQLARIPCTILIQSPVPININPGVSQTTATLPPAQPSTFPSSYVDYSTPTVAILRPPPSLDSVIESENMPIAAPSPTNPTFATIIREPINSHVTIDPKLTVSSIDNTKPAAHKARTQDSHGVPLENDEPESASDFESESAPSIARNGLPFVYAVLPASLPSPSYVSGATSTIPNSKSKSTPTSQPNRGKNPFFNVNKRKHFEYYEYF